VCVCVSVSVCQDVCVCVCVCALTILFCCLLVSMLKTSVRMAGVWAKICTHQTQSRSVAY
jgi:hypothetical protein